MKGEQLRVRAFRSNVNFDVLEVSAFTKTHKAERLVLTEIEEGYSINPTFTLTVDSAVELMNSLWDAGIRPSDGTGNKGQLSAVQSHLEDMRLIAFSQLGLKENAA